MNVSFLASRFTLDAMEWLEFAVLFAVIYLLLRFLRQTIAGGVFRGPNMLVWILVFGLFWILRALNLDTLALLAKRALPVFLLAMVVAFQTELRHGIARLGNAGWLQRLFGKTKDASKPQIEAQEITNAIRRLVSRGVGAIIAVERNIDLTTYIDTGVPLDAIIRTETLTTIFDTNTVLHDGAVVIRGNRIAAAGCLFPLAERPNMPRSYGTRHRAAFGLSDLSDAAVIVVSEENQELTYIEGGNTKADTTLSEVQRKLNTVFATRMEGGKLSESRRSSRRRA